MTAPDLTNIKLWIVVPEAGTNQIYNPRIDPPEYDTYLTAVNSALAESATYQRRGAYSVEVTPDTGTAAGFYYSAVSVTNGTAYTFSCDVKGVAGQAMRIYIANSAGTAKATTTFTATGYWERHSVTHTAAETQADYRVYVIRDSVASTSVFYVDGLQFEASSEMTTFIHGDAGDGYSWAGLPRQSASSRTDRTRMGGSLLELSDYAHLVSMAGLGHGEWNQIMTSMSNGGSLYQQHLRKARNFSLVVDFIGDNLGDIYTNKNTILEAIRPDLLDGHEMKLIFQGFNDDGTEASHPLEIVCVPQSASLADPTDNPVHQRAVMNFTIPSGLLNGAYEEGAELDLYASFTIGYIVKRNADGQWCEWDTDHYDPLIDAVSGPVFGNIYSLGEGPDGTIYAGGAFTDAGGDTAADFLAKWNGTAWSAVGSSQLADSATAIIFDASGNLYIGAASANIGGVGDADYFAKWDGTNWTALGSGINAPVKAIAISPDGVIYIGGNFTTAGGDTACNYIAYYDTGTSNWKPLSTGLNNYVECMMFGNDGNLYIGGQFTDASYPYLCKWDGSAFSAINSASDINGIVYTIDFDASGNMYVGGAFTNAGGISYADYIAKWNGTQWDSLGKGFDGPVYWIECSANNDIYIAGKFTLSVDYSSRTNRLAKYTNGIFSAIDITLPNTDRANRIFESKYDGSLYIGGNFAGTAIASATHTITNSGNTNVYPKFVITGPGVMGSISNFRTKKSIQFEGLTLQAGETITINLDPTNLYMVSSWEGRGNVLRYVAAGSDYGNFALEPGENYINIYMPSGTDSNSGGYMTYTPRFWNIEGAIYE